MTEAEWLACGDPTAMLDSLSGRIDERKAWLLLCGFSRSLGGRLPGGLSRRAIVAVENYADRGVFTVSLNAGYLGVNDPSDADPWQNACRLARAKVRKRRFDQKKVAVIRDLIGNPFHSAAFDPAWLAWNSGTVAKLAAAIYKERRFTDLPIMADALEDAGCTNADVLTHLRGPGPHVRGCWVIDLLLGRS